MKRILLPLLLASLPPLVHAEIKLGKTFTPHMVLQRGMAVPVFGTASPGEEVKVQFRDQTKAVKADGAGKWRVQLDSLTAGGPDVLTVGNTKIDDVLVGDVWVGSGQSNMDMPVTSYTANDPHLAKNAEGTYPQLRLLKKGVADKWEQATPESIKTFSAMLFSFGLPLQKQLNVPIGLMVGAVGGTPSGYWLSEDMYKADAECKRVAAEYEVKRDLVAEKAKYAEEKAKFDKEFAEWKVKADAAKAAKQPMPRGPRGPDAVQPAGTGRGKIGNLFEAFVRPYVGYGIKGVLWDQGESKTAIVGVDQYTLMGALIRGWRHDWGQGDFPFLYNQKPSGGGPAWDYGDVVTEKANKFSALPPTVPLPDAGDYSYALHQKIMAYPNTFMVTALDLGGGTHPTNKSGYGVRGARVAMGGVYGDKTEIYGPLYASHEIKDGKTIIKFTHAGKGLAFKNGDKLQGFAIAGADKKFVWGDAVIEGDTVVVSSKTVTAPVAVRYAFSNQFPWANLFNKDGLPAQPFATDNR